MNPLTLTAFKTLLFVLLLANEGFAASSGVTYQGRIMRPDGSPISGQFTQFKLQIRTPDSGNCLMYEEVQSRDLRNSNGSFSLTMNDGTGSRTDASGFQIDRIFANRGTFTFDPATCSLGSSYTPSVGDGRSLVVLFKDETMSSWEPIPAQRVNYVPFAFESKQLSGFTADSILRVVNGSGDPLTGLAPLSNAQYTALLALANGTSNAYTPVGTLNGSSLPAMTSGQVLGWNGTSWVSTNATPTAGSVTSTMLAPNAVTSSVIAAGAVGTTAIASNVTVNTSGSLGARDFKIYPAGSGTGYVEMQASPSIADGTSYLLKWPATAGSSGQVLTTDGTGVLSWTAGGVSSQWTTHGANISYDVAGNVGIGTTAPTFPLEVKNFAGVTGSISSNNGVALTLRNDNAGNTNKWILGAGGSVIPADAFSIGDSSSYKMTMLANGNVGIGTTAPNDRVDVSGGNIVFGEDQTERFLGTNAYGGAIRFRSNAVSASDRNLQLGIRDNLHNFTSVMTVADGGNVGIGTTAPDKALTVKGNVGFHPGVDQYLAIGSYTDWSGVDGVSIGSINDANSAFRNINVASKNLILNATSGSGNVGIGTTAPTARLQLAAGTSAAGTAPLKFTNGPLLSAPEDGAVEYDGSGLYYTIGTTRYVIPTNTTAGNYTNVSSISNSSGSITMSPMAGNSVLINSSTVSTSPTSGALIVSGGVGVSGALNTSGNITSGGSLTVTTSGIIPQLYGSTSASGNIKIDGTSNATPGNVLLATAGGNVGIGTTAPANALDLSAPSYRPIRISRSGVAGNGAAMQIANSSGDTGEIAMEGSGILNIRANTGVGGAISVTSSGNVGIGTTAPASPLDVAGDSTFRGNVIGTNIAQFVNGYAQYGSIGNRLFFPQANTVAISTNSVERFRVDSSGNVGIGTTAPNAKLEINGSSLTNVEGVRIANTIPYGASGTQTASIGLGKIESGNWQPMGEIFSGPLSSSNSTEGYLAFSTRAGSVSGERVRINNLGNVGIGTTAPLSALDVVSAGNGISKNFGGFLQLNNLTRQYSVGVLDAGSTKFSIRDDSAAGTPTLVSIDGPSGNVGIGTTAPGSKLSVVGDGGVGSGPAVLSISPQNAGGSNTWVWATSTLDSAMTAGTSVIHLFGQSTALGNSSYVGYHHVSDNSPANFMTFGFYSRDNLMVLTNGGNVGIGTTSPGYKLDVAGAVNATALKINGVDVSATGAGAWAGSSSTIYTSTATSVGVGTSTPASQLANTSSNISDASGGLGVGPNAIDWAQSSVGYVAGFYNGSTAPYAGGVLIKGAGTSSNNTLLAVDSGATQTGGGGVPILRVTGNGFVGIGTTAPTAPLDINGANGQTTQFRVTNNDSVNGASYFSVNATSGNPYLEMQRWTGSGSNYNATRVMTNSTGDYAISTTSGAGAPIGSQTFTDRLHITGQGNVGIGTTAPLSKFNVEVANASNVNDGLIVSRFGGVDQFGVKLKSDGSGVYRSALTVKNSSNPEFEAMSFNTITGNVGIGTTAPTAQLHVAMADNKSAFVAEKFFGGLTGNVAEITATDGGWNKTGIVVGTKNGGADFNALEVWNNGSQSMTVRGNNVGIGTTAPAATLDIASGGIHVPRGEPNNYNASNFGYSFTIDGDTGMFSPYDGILNFWSNNIRTMTVNNGSVGIGTTAPAAKLDVQGQIRPSMGAPVTDPAGQAVDFASGNTQYATFTSCPATVNLYSMLEGGSYSLILIVPAGCTPSFSGTDMVYGGSSGTAVTAFKFPGGSTAASTGQPSVYSFLRANNFVFAAQVTDFR